MKIIKKKKFQPLYILLESEIEVAELYSCLNGKGIKGAAQEVFDYLLNHEHMNQSRADDLLKSEK